MPARASRRQIAFILAFSISYLALAASVIVARRNLEFLLNLVVMTLIIVAVLAVHRRAGLGAALLWNFSVWGLLHMIGGLAPIPQGRHAADTTGVAYNWRIIPGYLKYDQVVHAYGVGLVTWFCWQALSHRVRSDDASPLRPTLGIVSLCATAGMGFGALNEVVEFFAVLTLPQTNVGDYRNTGWDLVANLIGAVFTATILASRSGPSYTVPPPASRSRAEME